MSDTQKQVQPLYGNIIIETLPPQEEEEKTASGIVLRVKPVEKEIQQAVVIKVGTGVMENGTKVSDIVQVGQIVIFTKYSKPLNLGFTVDGKPASVLNMRDVIAVY